MRLLKTGPARGDAGAGRLAPARPARALGWARGARLARMLTARALAAGSAVAPAGPLLAQPFPEPAPIEAARAPARGAYDGRIDVLHYDVELGVSDRADWFEGRVRIRVRVVEADASLRLDLTGLAVDSVTVDGRPASARYADGVLAVDLAGRRAGDTARVAVAYSGTPDDGLFLGPHVHGAASAFADNWPNRTRFWLPSVDHPSDKATVRFTVHAPAEWAVVANGHLTGEPAPTRDGAPGPPAGPRRTWIWETGVPIPTYTMVIGAADMVVRPVGRAACGRAPASREADGCVEVSWWVFPEDTVRAARVFRRAAEMVDYYTELVGPYPYEKLANVQSGTRFGGMENSSAIFYTGEGLARGRLDEGTVAHEIAHQWFGDAVTETEWSHLWLSEGFATYFGALFFEGADGPGAFRERMERAKSAYLSSGHAVRPVVDRYENLYDLLNRNSYQKGGWVLHMLRGLLGDEAFFAGVRAYYERHLHGNALTADFRRAVEEASGRDLGWFFEQWLERPGHPVLEVRRRWIAEDGEVEVTIRQVQDRTWPRFRMPVTVALGSGAGAARHSVDMLGEETVVRLAAAAEPERVVLDPDGWLLWEPAAGAGGQGR